ncbi:MAG: hypothetical protein ACREMQ_11005 [Longimicrobiales bacterium]
MVITDKDPAPENGAGQRRNLHRRERFALVLALASILVVGLVVTGGFYSVFQTRLRQRATEGAGILAQEALRVFAQDASPEKLSSIGLGRDTLMTSVRIIIGESTTGAFTVLVGHVGPSIYRIKSTGRLETAKGPVICSVDLRWTPKAFEEKLHVSPALQPVCNGSPAESMIHLRAHEVKS